MQFLQSALSQTAPFTIGICFAVFGSAHAEDTGADEESILELTLGGGLGYEPDYEGSDDYELSLIPHAELSLYGGLASLSIGGLEAALPIGDHVFIGAGLGYDDGRDDDENIALNGLGDVDGTWIGSIGAGLALDPFSLALILNHDLGDSHEGYTVDLEAGYEIELIEDQVKLELGTNTTWASANYNEAYFGISASQAAASGLGQFDADAGFKSAGIGIGAGYALTDYAYLELELGYSRLLGDAADSPIVDDLGDPNQFSAGLILALQFGLL
ncbi:MAG: MipA/OmpV family protein [Geminicoccaceae bacterium]